MFCVWKEAGRQYDARVDTVQHLHAGWNVLNCFIGPQGSVFLEMLHCSSVRTAFCLENA
jgi:hypothetical protein